MILRKHYRAKQAHTMHLTTMYSSLNKHAPKKKKVLQGNEKPHMNKYLRRAIMKRSKLKKVANKTKNLLDIMNYKNNVIM